MKIAYNFVKAKPSDIIVLPKKYRIKIGKVYHFIDFIQLCKDGNNIILGNLEDVHIVKSGDLTTLKEIYKNEKD